MVKAWQTECLPHPYCPLPNFFLVGAAKAGTTSLYHYLKQHPGIYMSPIKEPNYFAEEIRVQNLELSMRRLAEARAPSLRKYLDGPAKENFSGGPVEEWKDYLKLFAHASEETAIGEASPCYLWSPTAPARIAQVFPNARIIIVLRDPADRAFSQYRHMMTFASRNISFTTFVDQGMADTGERISETYPFLHFGFYFEQIERYLEHFPREQIQIGFYEDFVADPQAFLSAIHRFLDVKPTFNTDLSIRHMQARIPRSRRVNETLKRLNLWGIGQKVVTSRPIRSLIHRSVYQARNVLAMTPCERARLVAFYRSDIEGLPGLLDRDLSRWLQ